MIGPRAGRSTSRRSAARGSGAVLRALSVLVLALSLASAAHAKRGAAGFERRDATLAGRPLSITPDVGGEGTAALLVLVADEIPPPPESEPEPEDPCAPATPPTMSLWRLDYSATTSAPDASRLLGELPGRVGRILTIDLDRDGRRDRLLLLPGRLALISGTPPAERTLLADSELHPRTSELIETADGPLLSIAGLGSARFLRPGPDGSFAPVADVRIPIDAQVRGHAFRLSSAPPQRIPGDPSTPRWSSPPSAEGDTRLSGSLIDPAAKPPRLDWWAGLPAAEVLIDSMFLSIGDRPALMVTTRPADKLGIFGEKRLRLFRLEEDRSRTGHPPFFAVESRINLWQTPIPELLDLNGDGVVDLALAYWKGLTKSQVAIDVYLGDGRGGFETGPKSTEFSVKRGDRSFLSFGRDWDGDGRPDLVIVGNGKLRLHRGRATDGKARRLVAEDPDAVIKIAQESETDAEIEVSLSSEGMQLEGEGLSGGPVTPLDVDHDGLYEALLVQRGAEGWKLGLLRFTRP